MRIAGAHVIVTGGASGLGEATAKLLVESGARVTLIDLSPRIEDVARTLGATALRADVTAPEMETSLQGLGDIHGLVNCAGIGGAQRIAGRDGPMPLEAFRKVIHVNLIGTFNMMRLVATKMTSQEPRGEERGVIVNTASVAAQDGQIGQAAYAASKGGIVSLALPAAREFARFGIRVNTIAPGLFRTPLMDELPEEAQKAIAASIPFPARLGDPAEFAEAVRFLFENAYINAELIRLDGAVRLPSR